MEQFLSYFIFDPIGLIILSTLFIAFLVQVFFYISYYNKPFLHSKKNNNGSRVSENTPSVSVVIIVKNESENLAKNLPLILNQDYPNYEVIVVNDGSTDESDILLKSFKLEYPHLYSTFSPISYDNGSHRQKTLSLTIGIKAATKDVLLFTEIDCVPMSNNWINSMMKNLTSEKEIVLGYCLYKTSRKNLWKRIAIFDNLLFSLQYLSSAIKHKPYTGIYRNIAYRKNIFFDNKGFSSSLKYENADEVFLNYIMNETNTVVSLEKDSFVSCDLEYYSMWKFIKTNYMVAKNHFMNYKGSIFHVETLSRYLFYILTVTLIAYNSFSGLWVYLGIGALIFIGRFTMQHIIFKRSIKYFEAESGNFFLIKDILQPFYNWYFKMQSHKKKRRLL